MKYNIFKSREIDYIQKLFSQNKKSFFPNSEKDKIRKIEIKPVSPPWAKNTCLNKYKVKLSNNQIKEIRQTSEVKKSKKGVWEIMNFIYNSPVNKPLKTIARPIKFIPQYNILFYEEVPGTPLAELIAENKQKEIEEAFVLSAKWLAKLHKLKVPSKFPKAFYPGTKKYQTLLKQIEKFLPELKVHLIEKEKLEFTDKIWKIKNTLIHADFYPGNIIVEKGNLSVIDFDKAGRGPALMDVATLYECLNFPDSIWKIKLSSKERKKIQKVFIERYCKESGIDLEKTKQALKKFLAKIFLDQIKYHFYFNLQNIPTMSPKDRKNLVKKIKDLLLKTKTYL